MHAVLRALRVSVVILAVLPGCALFEGRRQAADCVTRHAARVRTGLAELAPVVPERVRPAVFKLARETLEVEKWGRALTEDFKLPEARLELGGDAEEVGRTRYVVAARTKNAIVEAIPKLPEPGNLLGLLAGGGAGLTGIAGIAAAFIRRKLKTLAGDRDRARSAADDLDQAVDQMKQKAKNGGLDADNFAKVMGERPLARRHHAERKVRESQPV